MGGSPGPPGCKRAISGAALPERWSQMGESGILTQCPVLQPCSPSSWGGGSPSSDQPPMARCLSPQEPKGMNSFPELRSGSDPSWSVTDGVGKWKPGRAMGWRQASLTLGKSADSSPSSPQALVVGKQEAAPRRLMAGGVGHLAGTNKVWRGAEAITHLPPCPTFHELPRCPPKDCRASVTGGNVTA